MSTATHWTHSSPKTGATIEPSDLDIELKPDFDTEPVVTYEPAPNAPRDDRTNWSSQAASAVLTDLHRLLSETI